jgi:DNA-directed RNA polymerase I, II, and III subunit RPABC1
MDRCNGYDVCLLVVAEPLTTANIKAINEYQKKNDLQINMQVFKISELQYNVIKHDLVPKHEVISDKEEIDKIVAQFKIKNCHQLPLIKESDPVARYYAIKPGQLVKITRISPSAGEYILYRCCV